MSDELQSAEIPPRNVAQVATLANSTTLKEIERKKRINKAIVIALSSLATIALAFNVWAPWNFVAGGVLFIVAVVVAFFTNALTPDELDALLSKLAKSSEAAATHAESLTKKDGAP